MNEPQAPMILLLAFANIFFEELYKLYVLASSYFLEDIKDDDFLSELEAIDPNWGDSIPVHPQNTSPQNLG
jgi:hypothetical protein